MTGMVGKPMSKKRGSARSITSRPFLWPTTWKQRRKCVQKSQEEPRALILLSLTHLHNCDGTVSDGRPIDGAHHDSSCGEWTGPGQSSVDLLEEVDQRPWTRHKTTHLTLPYYINRILVISKPTRNLGNFVTFSKQTFFFFIMCMII